ncbi:hypothetical protein cypCar_00039522 [Cyprinus carpio]|nr:hypothetical protein cypCar_00039522 [Cyprinus carpio]
MAPKKAKKRAEGANSNVFSMFEQTQIQEFKEVQTKRSFDSNCYDNCLYRDSSTVISSIYSEIAVYYILHPSHTHFYLFHLPQAFTIMDQNRDGFIDKNDLRDTFAALGRLNVKQEELDEMLKEAPGPINFTVFLTMFGEKLKGADAEETILNAFKVFDPEGKGTLRKDFFNIKCDAYLSARHERNSLARMLTTQADRFSSEETEQMFSAFPPDAAGNVDYKNLVYIITHGEEKDQE